MFNAFASGFFFLFLFLKSIPVYSYINMKPQHNIIVVKHEVHAMLPAIFISQNFTSLLVATVLLGSLYLILLFLSDNIFNGKKSLCLSFPTQANMQQSGMKTGENWGILNCISKERKYCLSFLFFWKDKNQIQNIS